VPCVLIPEPYGALIPGFSIVQKLCISRIKSFSLAEAAHDSLGSCIPGLGGRSDHCKDVIVVVRRTRKSGERPERLQNDLPDNVLGRLLVRI